LFIEGIIDLLCEGEEDKVTVEFEASKEVEVPKKKVRKEVDKPEEG